MVDQPQYKIPDTMRPEEWPRLSMKPKKREKFLENSVEEEDYLNVISEARAKLETCVVPSVPRVPKEEGETCSVFQGPGKPEGKILSRT